MAKDKMAPDVSPGGISKKSGVRRVNNVPVFIVGGVVIVFLVVMMLVAEDRAAKQNASTGTGKEQGGNAAMFAKAIVGDRADGFVPPAAASPPKPAEKPKPAAAAPPPASAPAPAPLPERPASAPVDEDKEATLFRMAKLQMFKDAVKASPAVKIDMARSGGSAPGGKGGAPRASDDMLASLAEMRARADAHRSDDPTATYKTLLAAARGVASGGTGSGGDPAQPRDSMAQFDKGSHGDRWKLNSKLQAPRSPYELRAGFIIPATLISGINSDLPGKIIAQVAQDVYDTPTGKYLLIPLGSRLLGEYSNEVLYGQERVLVGWQRIIFPDGKALDIGAMPGSDSAGYAGFHDLVNNHYVRLFAGAFLMSGIVGAITYNQDQANYKRGYGGYGNVAPPSASDAFTQALGQQLGQVSMELIRKNMNIAPTIEIRPGYRFNVVVIKDLTFSKPYSEFDY